MPIDGVAIHRQALLKSEWLSGRSVPPHPILFYVNRE